MFLVLRKLSKNVSKSVTFNSNLCSARSFAHIRKIPCSTPKVQNIVFKKQFHISPRCNALPPLIAIIARPLAKILAILFGRSIRKWLQRLPPEERDKIIAKIKSKNAYILSGLSVFSLFLYLYYLTHLEEEPITKRKRFILYSDEQMVNIAEMEFQGQIEVHKDDIVSPSHLIYIRIGRIVNRLLHANKDLEHLRNKVWSITVVDRPDIVNAFVLPHGKIVVFTGILEMATSDDQLAVILSHEMAHAILSHMTENLSKALILELIFLLPLVLLWALLPDAMALFSQWLSARLADIVFHLPFSRAIESEADVVGLQLAARACFDIREGPVFWTKMAKLTDEPPEWLSTHPSNESRVHELSQLIPEALGIRETCQCARLPPMTPAQMFCIRPTNTVSNKS